MTKYNKNDIAKLEAEIKEFLGTPEEDRAIDKYTGPDTGLVWDEDAKVLKLAESYMFDASGYIVRKDDVTGPGVQ